MQTRSSPIPQRIVHYEGEANRLRRIAEAEPMREPGAAIAAAIE